MPRLKNALTGVVVNVPDKVAAAMTGFEPVKAEPKRAAKSDTK